MKPIFLFISFDFIILCLVMGMPGSISSLNEEFNRYLLTPANVTIMLPVEWSVSQEDESMIAFSQSQEIFLAAINSRETDTMEEVKAILAQRYGIQLTSFSRIHYPRIDELDTELTYYIFSGWATWGEEINEEVLKYYLLVGQKQENYFIVITIGYYMMTKAFENQIVNIMKEIVANN